MTGIEIQDGDGIWDDGEWISWEWINSQLEDEPGEDAYAVEHLEPYQSRDGLPFSVLEQTEIFHAVIVINTVISAAHKNLFDLGKRPGVSSIGNIKHFFAGADRGDRPWCVLIFRQPAAAQLAV